MTMDAKLVNNFCYISKILVHKILRKLLGAGNSRAGPGLPYNIVYK